MQARWFLAAACVGVLVGTTAFAVVVPSKAKQIKGEFVTAYNACSAPTTFMHPPFSMSACTPVRTNALCGFGPGGAGRYSLKIKGSDIAIRASWTGLDVGCEGTNLYIVAEPFRMTTSDCDGGDCTLLELSPFTLGYCTVALGRCTIKSTLEDYGYGSQAFKAGQTYSAEFGRLCAYSLIGSANAFCSGLKIAAP
jgi:hypothetical protein